MDAANFAVVYLALYTGHSVGDHWIQTGHQSATKGNPGKEGRTACLRHVLTLTGTKFIVLAVSWATLRMDLSILAVLGGLTLDAVSHYWADRRFTLEKLAARLKKGGFYNLGADTSHRNSPDGSHIGTGKYALDQSFHVLFIFLTAIICTLG